MKRYFGDKERFKIGQEIAHMEDAEIVAKYQGKSEEMIGLKNRYQKWAAAFAEKRMSIPLTDTEREMLDPPLKRMIQKSGMDIPPNLAFVIALGQIAGARLASIYWE